MKREELLNKMGIVVPEIRKVRVIIDTDAKNEADDQYAIMHHLLSPSFIIEGIIATHFEAKMGHNKTTMIQSYEEIKKLLEYAEIDDVKVLKGAVSPLFNKQTFVDNEGSDFIIEQAKKEGKLYIAVQGALTNVASALLKDPSIANNIVVLFNGGGPYPEGRFEFNVFQDPEAARVVFESEAEIWQTTQDVYATLEVTLAELKQKVYPCGKIGQYLYNQLEEYNKIETAMMPDFLLRAGENWCLGDNTTIAVLLMNRFRGNYHMEHAPIIKDDLTYQNNPDGKLIRVYDFIDVRMTLEDLFSKLALAYK